MPIFFLGNSKKGNKRYYVRELGTNKTVHFGDKNYENYTIHKDNDRKLSYLSRHYRREDWTPSGIYTPGFWSRFLLWSRPTLDASIRELQRLYGIKVRKLKSFRP